MLTKPWLWKSVAMPAQGQKSWDSNHARTPTQKDREQESLPTARALPGPYWTRSILICSGLSRSAFRNRSLSHRMGVPQTGLFLSLAKLEMGSRSAAVRMAVLAQQQHLDPLA